MTREEWQTIVAMVRAAWPEATFDEERADLYFAALADLAPPEARAAIVQLAGSPELPRPGDILRAASRPATAGLTENAPSSEDDFVIVLGSESGQPEQATTTARPVESPAASGSSGGPSPSLSPRMRRLQADWEAVRSEFSGHPLVTVEALGTAPSDKYKVTYRLTGVALQGDKPVRTHVHECEIHLPAGYPREQPLVLPLTPIFHPNVSDRYCIADYWSAGEGLMDVITRLAKIIQYQSYNTKSPLNGRAAYWAENNPGLFPIGHEQLGRGDISISLGG